MTAATPADDREIMSAKGVIADEIAKEQGESVKIVKVDVDNSSHLSNRFGIRNVPTLLFFKGVQAEDVKNLLASGATDEQVAAWFDANGIPKTADEIKAWADSVEAIQPYQNPEQREWFASECTRLGLDPVKSRFCDYLDTDDRVSFAK